MGLFLAVMVVLVVFYMVSFHGRFFNHAVITIRLMDSTMTFLPCYFWVFVHPMFFFSGFFYHAERSHVSFLLFWVIFLTWVLLCFYIGVFFLHWMFFMLIHVKKIAFWKTSVLCVFRLFGFFIFFGFFQFFFSFFLQCYRKLRFTMQRSKIVLKYSGFFLFMVGFTM